MHRFQNKGTEITHQRHVLSAYSPQFAQCGIITAGPEGLPAPAAAQAQARASAHHESCLTEEDVTSAGEARLTPMYSPSWPEYLSSLFSGLVLSPVPGITGAPAWQKMGTERKRELSVSLLGVMLVVLPGQHMGGRVRRAVHLAKAVHCAAQWPSTQPWRFKLSQILPVILRTHGNNHTAACSAGQKQKRNWKKPICKKCYTI